MKTRLVMLIGVAALVAIWHQRGLTQTSPASEVEDARLRTWEYKVLSVDKVLEEIYGDEGVSQDVPVELANKKFEAWLNEHGERGWELCAWGSSTIFKRWPQN